MSLDHINPHQMSYATGVARQTCARVFRDGGSPVDALEMFGLAGSSDTTDWSTAVEMIAAALCSRSPVQRAA